MEIQKEESTLIEEPSMTKTNAQINPQFSHGKLVLTAKEISLTDEPAMNDLNNEFEVNFSHGELHLTAKKISLADEIKILIRKLWN